MRSLGHSGGVMKRHTGAGLTLALLLLLATLSAGETRKEYRYTVGQRASISVFNQYGPITVRPAAGNQVSVVAILHSNKVEIDQHQSGSRVELQSHLLPGSDADNGKVEYEVEVPAGAAITLRSSTGPLTVERLTGDVTLEGASAVVDVRDISNAHVHVKTLNGPITLSNINQGHVEVTSVSGDIKMHAVSGPLVSISSSSGKILYDGDFGGGGEYTLTSHTGDIEAQVSPQASLDVSARSVKGQVDTDFPLQPKKHTAFLIEKGRSFVGTAGTAASTVLLRSFSGKIRLKKR
jgi:DUF4097 and DUF4098 domain-containing protein YvlB